MHVLGLGVRVNANGTVDIELQNVNLEHIGFFLVEDLAQVVTDMARDQIIRQQSQRN